MFYDDKLVLVTGGTGFIGTNFIDELLKSTKAKIRVPIHKRVLNISSSRIETMDADLSILDDCVKVTRQVDCIFHAAGAVAAAAVTTTNPMEAIIQNLVLTARVLQGAWENNVDRILIFSSSTGYPAFDHPIKEEEMWLAEPHPVYYGYGWMRRYLEKLGDYVGIKSKVKVAIARPTAVYGRWDDFDPLVGHVVPALIKRAIEKEDPYVVWGTGNEVRDFLHASDLVKGCLLLLEKCANRNPVNIGYGKTITVKEIVNYILKYTGHAEVSVVYDSSKPTTIPKRMVDISKAKTLLNFQPTMTIEQGLKDTIEWYLESSVKKK
jgi:GDP-L-fucose synthase